MTAVAAAMAGFLLPLLASQRSFINAWFLRRGAAWLFAAVIVGVVEMVIGRWLFVVFLAQLGKHFRRVNKVLAECLRVRPSFRRSPRMKTSC